MKVLLLFELVFLEFACLQAVLINDWLLIIVMTILLLVIGMLLIKQSLSNSKKSVTILFALTIAYIASMIGWRIGELRILWYLSQILVIVTSLYYLYLGFKTFFNSNGWFKKSLVMIAMSICGLFPAMMTYFIVSPDMIGKILQQSVKTVNSFEAQEQFEAEVSNGN